MNGDVTPNNYYSITNIYFVIHETDHVVNQWQEGMTTFNYISAGLNHDKNKYEISADNTADELSDTAVNYAEDLM